MKRKSYERRMLDLVREAKAETIALMREHETREIDIKRWKIPVISENEAGQLTAYTVTKVAVANYTGEDVLEWDYDGPGAWIDYNPYRWLRIHKAVCYNFGEYHKRFLVDL